MRKLASLIALALVSVGLVASPSSATSGPNTTGYIWHMGGPSGGQLMRYNAEENVDEPIDTSDPTCAPLRLAYAYDFALDPVRQDIYWTSWYWNGNHNYLSRMNLQSGVCQSVADQSALNANGLSSTWRGIEIDPVKGYLFLANNVAYVKNAITENTSLQYVDLKTLPATGVVPAGVVQSVVINMGPSETEDIQFADDLYLDGDYMYMTAKGRPNNVGVNGDEGSGVFKVQVYDGAGQIMATSSSQQVYRYIHEVDELSNDHENLPQPVHVEIHNGFLYMSHNSWRVGGIQKVDLSGATPGNPVTAHSWLFTNDNTYSVEWGFTFAENDVLFGTDQPVWPGPYNLFYMDGSVNAPTINSGNILANTTSDTYFFAQLAFSKEMGPDKPVISSAVRDSATNATLTFAAPARTSPVMQYSFTATGSDGSVLTGLCTASPCGVSGLVSGVTYSYTARVAWMNGPVEVIHSLKSASVSETVPVVGPSKTTKQFAGFVTMKSKLSNSQKSAIRSWVNANPTMTSVSCVGYVGHNWKGVSNAALKALALARAKAVCSYVHSVKSSIAIGKSTIKITDSRNGSIRKVVATLKK